MPTQEIPSCGSRASPCTTTSIHISSPFPGSRGQCRVWRWEPGQSAAGVWGGTDEHAAIATIRDALYQGISLIDTAPVYGFGISERIVGRAVAGLRSSAVTRCRDSTRDGLHPELNNHRSCRPGIHGAPAAVLGRSDRGDSLALGSCSSRNGPDAGVLGDSIQNR